MPKLILTMLIRTEEDLIIAQHELWSLDIQWVRWRFALPLPDMVAYIWTLLHGPRNFMEVKIVNEEILYKCV